MKSLETIYNELEELLIKKLPEYIENTNKLYNDNLILKNFENTSLEENCIKQPCFKITFINGEYSEKDRIIENTVFIISLEIKLQPHTENKHFLLCRYYEAIEMTINNNEDLQECKISGSKENKVFIKIIV